MAQEWEREGACTAQSLHTRRPAGHGGRPWEQGQQQDRGAQHAGLAAGSVWGPGAAAPVQAAPGPAGEQVSLSLAGQPLRGEERGWQNEG